MYIADFKVTKKTILLQALRKIFIRLTIGSFILFLIYLLVQRPSIFKRNSIKSETIISNLFRLYSDYDYRTYNIFLNLETKLNSIPTISRTLYLFLCENQDEINAYSKVFPSITADVVFFCWRDNCNDANFSKFTTFYVAQWLGSISKDQPIFRTDPEVNYTKITPRVFIINEQQLNLPEKTTWSTARNLLLERALLEEHQQGWRWAYFTFGDGDIQVNCSLAEKLRQTNQVDEDEIVFADHFRSLINKTINHDQCFVLFDTFLLSVSPAIGVIDGMLIPSLYDGLLTQIVYHVDAMFNAFHRDAMPFVLPYCTRYDTRSWWTSQAILIYRSLCLYGHVIQFNGVMIDQEKHRSYPKNGDPWAIDQNMNLVPSALIPLQMYMQQSRVISPLILRQYNGWSLEITSNQCRQGHTFMHPLTCKVSGELNKTNL